MKTLTGYFAGITLVLCSVSACKKENAKPEEKMIAIAVVEYKSNLPVTGATVEYYKDCNCFPGGANIVLSKKTGNGGICEIPESIFNNVNYGIIISPPPGHPDPGVDYDYWPIGSAFVHSSERTYALPILGDAKLHLIKSNNFPAGSYMQIREEGEQSSFQVLDIGSVVGLPSDSSFVFYSYRAQTCTFTWNIFDASGNIISSGGPLAIDIPKTGVQEVVINY